MKYMEQRYTQITVVPEGDTIFSEQATHISIEDEGAGEYLRVSQISDHAEKGTILITPEEWLTIRNAIDIMTALCRKGGA